VIHHATEQTIYIQSRIFYEICVQAGVMSRKMCRSIRESSLKSYENYKLEKIFEDPDDRASLIAGKDLDIMFQNLKF